MIIDKKIEQEYFLLRNYQETGQNTRELSLRMCFEALEKIDSNNWFVKFEEPNLQNKKNNAKCLIQLEIISKIMFYIEDLAIISESLLRGTNYYELLDPADTNTDDIGKLIKNFFSKMDLLSHDELCKIMSYKIPNTSNFDKECIELLTKMINADIEETRRILKLIGIFGKEHHPVFRRYKHAGLPFIFRINMEQDLEFFKNFDFSSAVLVKEHEPFRDMQVIPYSEDVIEGYKIMIKDIRKFLRRIIENRIGCIQREVDWIIPTTSFSVQLFSMDELRKIKSKSEKYLSDNPPKNTSFNFNFHLNLKNDSWYKKLPEFLKECRRIGQMEKEIQEKIDKEFKIGKN
ncbi:MAG: hypothetical protein ACREA3_09505 [Nitrosotalea sp.]